MKKEKECSIVQDLLLNYVDGVLSSDSKEFVEVHTRECKNCQEKLEELKKDMEENEKSEEKEVDYLKNVKKKIHKKNKVIIIVGVILAITIILNIAVFINYSITACEMEIYLNDDITELELKDIEQMIKSKDNNAEIIYHSKQDGLEKMKEKFGENKYLLNGYEGDNNPFPAWCTVNTKLSETKEIKESIEMMAGVRKITSYVDSNPYDVFLYKCIKIFKNN